MNRMKIELDDSITIGIIVGIIVWIIGIVLVILLLPPVHKPTALDVYQGKTTLEITYRDSIPVDSIVVFKEEFKLVE